MTKTDAEQHAAVWGLANKFLQEELHQATTDRIELLSAALLAQSSLAKYVAQSYQVMAESIME